MLELPASALLHRLFHEEDAQLLGERPLSFACSCSRERVGAMLQSLGAEEAYAALSDERASIRCEFCGQTYMFDRQDLDAIFIQGALQSPAPEQLQ